MKASQQQYVQYVLVYFYKTVKTKVMWWILLVKKNTKNQVNKPKVNLLLLLSNSLVCLFWLSSKLSGTCFEYILYWIEHFWSLRCSKMTFQTSKWQKETKSIWRIFVHLSLYSVQVGNSTNRNFRHVWALIFLTW